MDARRTGIVEVTRRATGSALAAAADLLMPQRCGGCDLPGVLLCPRCSAALPRIAVEGACPRCGAPDGVDGCAECRDAEVSFSAARCAGVFEWPLSRLVTLHKDAGELRLTPVLASLAVEAAGEWVAWAEAIVPVPASPGARARRGFDHGALLAAEMARQTGATAYEALRARPRRDQRHLTREMRAANAGASLVAATGVSVPSRVLVVDDVMTTGATMESATRALMAAGAREVRAVAVARASSGRI